MIADGLASRLSIVGYDVTGIADSAGEAMEKIRDRVPELILIDIHIKGRMDAIETTTLFGLSMSPLAKCKLDITPEGGGSVWTS